MENRTMGPEVGLVRRELNDIAPAFEHIQFEKAKKILDMHWRPRNWVSKC